MKNNVQKKEQKYKLEISRAWKRYHKNILFQSMFFSILLLLFAFIFQEGNPDISLTKRLMLYFAGFLFFTIIVASLLYILDFLPNYFFYKRMMKYGKEKEIYYMIGKYGLGKLINKSWFIFKEKTGLKGPSSTTLSEESDTNDT